MVVIFLYIFPQYRFVHMQEELVYVSLLNIFLFSIISLSLHPLKTGNVLVFAFLNYLYCEVYVKINVLKSESGIYPNFALIISQSCIQKCLLCIICQPHPVDKIAKKTI